MFCLAQSWMAPDLPYFCHAPVRDVLGDTTPRTKPGQRATPREWSNAPKAAWDCLPADRRAVFYETGREDRVQYMIIHFIFRVALQCGDMSGLYRLLWKLRNLPRFFARIPDSTFRSCQLRLDWFAWQ